MSGFYITPGITKQTNKALERINPSVRKPHPLPLPQLLPIPPLAMILLPLLHGTNLLQRLEPLLLPPAVPTRRADPIRRRGCHLPVRVLNPARRRHGGRLLVRSLLIRRLVLRPALEVAERACARGHRHLITVAVVEGHGVRGARCARQLLQLPHVLPLLLGGHFVRAVRGVVVPFFLVGCFFGLAGAVGGEGGFGGVEGVEGEAQEEGVD